MADLQQAAIGGYVFGNEWQQEYERLSLMEAGWDPYSVHNLSTLGDMTGWRCLEVGAGGGSISRWLAAQAGPSGQVLATDLDVRLLERIPSPPNLEVRRHNIVTEEVEQGVYDLVHTRLVLEHLPERQAVLQR
ncbi:MAG: class I SAM-dependent methyltransferase [Dehalococcoidia bacterium]|nr:class I SAM-dependent methyltransferase [Dehalococcoidia bacterium]